MELNQLETFLAVAEERSFSRAAVRMHRTQPAISQVIRKLEESVGESLFDRAARDGRDERHEVRLLLHLRHLRRTRPPADRGNASPGAHKSFFS